MELRILFTILRRFFTGSLLFVAFTLLLYKLMQTAAEHVLTENRV